MFDVAKKAARMVFKKLISRVICVVPVLTLTTYGTILLITHHNSYNFTCPHTHSGWILMLIGVILSAQMSVSFFLVYYVVLLFRGTVDN